MTQRERRQRRAGWALAALLAAVAPARCGNFSKSARGTTGAQFLELPTSARAAAMGSAQGAAVRDATALDYNPAVLASIEGGDAVFMHAEHFEGISYDTLAAAQRFGDAGTLALGLRSLSPGKIEEIDNTGAATGGSFAPRDTAVSLGYGRAFGNFELGAAGKYISSKIDKSASTFAADLGARLHWGLLALSASVANAGPGLKFREQSDPLPLTARLGSSYDWKNLVIALDLVAPRGTAPYPAVGLEYRSRVSEQLAVSMRLGYDGRLSQSRLGGLAGMAFGAGLEAGRLRFDYAAAPYGDLGLTHRLSAGLSWGAKRDTRRSDRKKVARKEASVEDDDLRRVRQSEKAGRIAREQSDCAQAKLSFGEAIRLAYAAGVNDPAVADAYAGMGRCLVEEDDFDYAAKFFNKALESGPSPQTRLLVEKELMALRPKR